VGSVKKNVLPDWIALSTHTRPPCASTICTLLTMARDIHNFRGASSLSTWLFTIARNACIRMHRQSKAAPREASTVDVGGTNEAQALADPARRADEVLASKQIARALGQAIGELEPMYREVLMLRDVEGLTAAAATRFSERSRSAASRPRRRPCRLRSRPP